MVLKSTKQNIKNSTITIMVFLLLVACNKPFSKYVKTGETDIEHAGYVGKVRQVDTYNNETLIKTTKYNEFGFLTEETEYAGESKQIVTLYRYNEYGKLVECEYTNETNHVIEYNTYDEFGNLLVSIRKLVPDGGEVIVDTLALYEYQYDEIGVLRYAKCRNLSMSCMTEKYYGSSGDMEKTVVTQQGELGPLVDSTYYTYKDGVLTNKVRFHGEPEYQSVDSFVYDEVGVVIREIGYCRDLLYREVRYAYIDGKLHQKVEKLYDEKEWEIICDNWLYDSCGNVREWTSIREYSSASYIPQITFHNKFEYEYDEAGNVICQKGSNCDEIRYAFSYFE